MPLVAAFLVSLFLAWPTYGISFLGFIAYAVFRASRRAERRVESSDFSRAADTARAVNNPLLFSSKYITEDMADRRPSWADNPSELDSFLFMTKVDSEILGVPKQFVHDIFEEESFLDGILDAAAQVEEKGGSLAEQKLVAIELVKGTWNRVVARSR